MTRIMKAAMLVAAALSVLNADAFAAESLAQFQERLAADAAKAYNASPFAQLSKDYFSRFSRDPKALPREGEVLVDSTWKIAVAQDGSPLSMRMAKHLSEFLKRMNIDVPLDDRPRAQLGQAAKSIVLLDSGGGDEKTAESFSIEATDQQIKVAGLDAPGLRDGVVNLVDAMGLRQAPIVKKGRQTFLPRIAVRLGATPHFGGMRETVFLGYNAVSVTGGSLFELSVSNAIPELASRRKPDALATLVKETAAAAEYGLKSYAVIETRKKFAKNDPIFTNYPEIRGALTWQADGDYVLCTEHPLVKQFLSESIAGLFKQAPGLSGVVIIIGGEGFYHCHMRSFGTPKGHTNCARCEKIGADTVVANLCNNLAEAARAVNPKAEVIAWPYSAVHVWSADATQAPFISLLKPGTAILTEVEKDEYINKGEGVNKHLWDYSIDMTGLGPRAVAQLAACKKAGISLYLKSEPEISLEALRMASIPCLDRWLARSEAVAASGARGCFCFPAFRPNFGTSAAEAFKYPCWQPALDSEQLLNLLAARIAGSEAGPRLRNAWKFISESIPLMPEIPPYYVGPYYLGPAHPMCADASAKLPETFYGRLLFMAEATDAEGLMLRPVYLSAPRGNVPVFARMYRDMEKLTAKALAEIAAAEPLVPQRCQLVFQSEASSIRWFCATARSHANFYESCQLRDRFQAILAKPADTAEKDARQVYDRWLAVLIDERANALAAVPVMVADVRLDFRFGGDHSLSPGAEILQAKLKLIEQEINEYLPSLWKKYEAARK